VILAWNSKGFVKGQRNDAVAVERALMERCLSQCPSPGESSNRHYKIPGVNLRVSRPSWLQERLAPGRVRSKFSPVDLVAAHPIPLEAATIGPA